MLHPTFSFLIIERDLFIAQDMRDGLLDACGICECRRFMSEADLMAAEDELRACRQMPVIITKRSLRDADAIGLTGMADRNSWPVVVRQDLDPPEAIAARGWLSLPSPFTRTDITAMVQQLHTAFPTMALRRA